MSCDSCSRAANDPCTGFFTVGCPHCSARALASSMPFFDSKSHGRLTAAYRQALPGAALPGEDLGATHRRVLEWAQRIAQAAALHTDSAQAHGGRP